MHQKYERNQEDEKICTYLGLENFASLGFLRGGWCLFIERVWGWRGKFLLFKEKAEESWWFLFLEGKPRAWIGIG